MRSVGFEPAIPWLSLDKNYPQKPLKFLFLLYDFRKQDKVMWS
jgi:hypothetical protein